MSPPSAAGCGATKGADDGNDDDGATPDHDLRGGAGAVGETKKRLSDVLCDDRPFINLTEVSLNDGESVEAFVAINKNYVRTVRVLHEGDGELVAMPSR